MSKEDTQRLGEYKRIEKIGEGKPNKNKVFCFEILPILFESLIKLYQKAI